MPRVLSRGVIMAGVPVAVVLAGLWLTGGFAGLLVLVAEAQRAAQDQLAGSVRALRGGQPAALAGLLGVAFTYGVLHAVGPGHGKALIGAYGVARRVTLAKLSGLALVASLAQAAVAVALVYLGVAALGLSRDAATGLAEGAVPALGNVLIAGLGLWLIWRGWRSLRARAVPHHHHHHDHAEEDACGCGHAHAPSVAQVEALSGWRDTGLLIAGIAMRPCSGALFLLILTWQIGIGAAGVAAAFAMGLGVAVVTVAAAALAVWAREGAFAGFGLAGGSFARALPLIEIILGGLIAAVALVLLAQGWGV